MLWIYLWIWFRCSFEYCTACSTGYIPQDAPSNHRAQQMPSITEKVKLITGSYSASLCHWWPIIMNHSSNWEKIDRNFINFSVPMSFLCNKCLLYTGKVIKYQFHGNLGIMFKRLMRHYFYCGGTVTAPWVRRVPVILISHHLARFVFFSLSLSLGP